MIIKRTKTVQQKRMETKHPEIQPLLKEEYAYTIKLFGVPIYKDSNKFCCEYDSKESANQSGFRK